MLDFKKIPTTELRAFLNRRAIDRMEAAYMDAAREELKRREVEGDNSMDGQQTA